MAKAIKMPDLGTAVKEVTLLTWLKEEGECVKRGESLCEVETDKATSELESAAEGILLRQIVPAGSTVTIGEVIAYIGKNGETVSDAALEKLDPESAKSVPPPPSGRSGPSKASPMIRNLAQRMGIELSEVVGSGPGGQITRTDVLEAREKATANGDDKEKAGTPQRLTLTKNQVGVAQTITQSWQEIVPIQLFGQINMSAAIQLRQRFLNEHGQNLSYDAVFIHALSRVMKDFPRFRCRLSDSELIVTEEVHIGVAISSAEDLYIPVLSHTDRKSLGELEEAVRQFSEKASGGTFTLEELSGATFTFSNLGMYPIRSFTAIIPPGQSGILTVGRIEEEVSLGENRQLRTEPQTSAVLSVDHRFINGRQGAEFMARLKETMENL